MDRLTPEQRHKNMVAVKAKGTKPELLLAKAMWNAGLRYRKNDENGYPEDPTRLPAYYDGTYRYLKSLGLIDLDEE